MGRVLNTRYTFHQDKARASTKGFCSIMGLVGRDGGVVSLFLVVGIFVSREVGQEDDSAEGRVPDGLRGGVLLVLGGLRWCWGVGWSLEPRCSRAGGWTERLGAADENRDDNIDASKSNVVTSECC